MKNYSIPEISIELFMTEDVITTSGGQTHQTALEKAQGDATKNGELKHTFTVTL